MVKHTQTIRGVAAILFKLVHVLELIVWMFKDFKYIQKSKGKLVKEIR